MSNFALILVLVATLLGYSTAVGVKLVANVSIPTPIIGDAIFEDLETPAPIIGQGIFEDLENITHGVNHRYLQAAYPPNGFQTELLNAVNRERTAKGISPLCMNTKLQNAAQGHSNDMAAKDYMSHTGSDGSKMSQRIQRAGYDRTASGENVAAGHTTVQEVMTAWMNSPRHRDNILRKKFTMFGCGYAYSESSTYKHYWTQNFGRSNTEKCS
ncbi:Cysteine-rich secretory protein family [Phytophthora infestans]|uniref:Cysteine-rich secretory protein family n=1 Tax=Phytophthora infestans TaxID=4787 RepID=A0A8S9TU14_PHYIN|nr:Cysteine-rich secretory protein family [Phytophthora infestans]